MDLKPCWKCNRKPSLEKDSSKVVFPVNDSNWKDDYYVVCLSVGCDNEWQTGYCDSAGEAIQKWNNKQ